MSLRAPLRGETPIEGLPEPGTPYRYAAYHGGMTSHLVHRTYTDITYCGRSVAPDVPRIDWWVIEDTRSKPKICGECKTKDKQWLTNDRARQRQESVATEEYVDFRDADLDFALAVAAEMVRQDPLGIGAIHGDQGNDQTNPFI